MEEPETEQAEESENLEKSEKLEINDSLGSAFDLLKPSKESHEPKTPKKSLEQMKTPKKSFKLSTVAKLTSSMKRTNSEKGRSKSTSAELATISEGRLARSKSLKTKRDSTKIKSLMAKSLVTNLIIDQATAQKFGLPMGYVGKEMDEIDTSDQKLTMFEAAMAADLAYYQRSSSDREGCRSRVSSIGGDDSVFSGDRQEQLNLWIPGSKQVVSWFSYISAWSI